MKATDTARRPIESDKIERSKFSEFDNWRLNRSLRQSAYSFLPLRVERRSGWCDGVGHFQDSFRSSTGARYLSRCLQPGQRETAISADLAYHACPANTCRILTTSSFCSGLSFRTYTCIELCQ